MSTAQQFNWIDILVVIILFRIGYVALKSGFIAEFFKLLGTILATYLSLHYFIVLSDFICRWKVLKNIPLEFLTFLTFSALSILGYLIFVVLRTIFSLFFKMEATPTLNKWGGFILGIIRGFLLVSLIIFILNLFPFDYFRKSTNNSYSGKRFFKIAPLAYRGLWDSIMSKFMWQEKLNESIFRVQTKSNPK